MEDNPPKYEVKPLTLLPFNYYIWHITLFGRINIYNTCEDCALMNQLPLINSLGS